MSVCSCQCTCQLAAKLSNKFNFFLGHKDGFWQNVVVNLAMAKRKFERLLIHIFIWAIFEKLLHRLLQLLFSTEALDLLSELKKKKDLSHKKNNIITSWSRGRLKCILLKVNHKNNLNVSRENKGHYFLLTISSVIVSEKISQKVETWISLCVAVPYPRQLRLHVG